jgi:anti-sigma B factor antagonist
MLNIREKRIDPDIVVMEMAGRITLGRDSQQVEWDLVKLIEENQKKIIFDLTAVEHVDSTGIGIIVMCTGKLKNAGGTLRVAGLRPQIEHVFKLTSIDKIVEMYPTTELAVQDFN